MQEYMPCYSAYRPSYHSTAIVTHLAGGGLCASGGDVAGGGLAAATGGGLCTAGGGLCTVAGGGLCTAGGGLCTAVGGLLRVCVGGGRGVGESALGGGLSTGGGEGITLQCFLKYRLGSSTCSAQQVVELQHVDVWWDGMLG